MNIIRLTVALDESDFRRMDKAIYTLSQKGIRVSRSLLVRALVRSMHGPDKLIAVIEDLRKHSPDGRKDRSDRRA